MAHISKKRSGDWPKGIFRDVFVCSRQELSPFGSVFVFQADNVEEKHLGTIFGIIKIDDRSEESSYVANLLVSVMKKEYFGKPHRTAEESFEASLRKANLALAELARHGSLGWSGKINFTSGALAKNNLHFAYLGNVGAFLFRDGQIIEIGRESDDEKTQEPHPLKTFSNISSGKLEHGDKLVFATQDLFEIFSKKELRQNASHFSREEFPGFLEMSLEANAELAGAIVVDLAEEKIPARAPLEVLRKEIPKISAAPSAIPAEKPKNIDSFMKIPDIARMPEATFPAAAETGKQEFFRKKFPQILKRYFFLALDGTKRLAAEAAAYPGEALRKRKIRAADENVRDSAPAGRFSVRDFRKPAAAIRATGRKIGETADRAKRRIQEIDRKKRNNVLKISGGVVLLAIAIFAVFAFTGEKNDSEAVPPPENAPLENPAALALDDLEAKKVESVENFAGFGQTQARIALLNGFLWAVSGNDTNISRINVETKETEEIKSGLSAGNFELLSAMPDLNTIFILTGDRKMVSFTPVNKNFQENGISLPGNLKSADIRSYLTYLYVLDTANSRINRYPRAEGGFGEGPNWLRVETDLKGAKGIAVNDDLYLAESGKITAWLQGRPAGKTDFESPRTPLSIDRIYSEPGMEFVWVLDNENRRVIKYSKEGKIIAQYFNESFSGAADFIADEKNKTVYLLKGNQVVKFPFE